MRKTMLLLILVLCLIPPAVAENYVPIELDVEERYVMNLFLSNFTEVGLERADGYSDDQTLVDFAHDHMWFNSYDSFEYGEYFDGNNCRVSDDRIQEIIDQYFYYAEDVDLSQTRFDYDGEYYYHCETGGWNDNGFAHAVNVVPIGNNKYFVSFYVFSNGEFWKNCVLDDALDSIMERYDTPAAYGSALVYSEDLADRDAYKLISYALV